MVNSNRVVRVGLVTTLVIAIALAVPFFRHEYGALLGAEALSVVALALLLAFRQGQHQLAAAGAAFVAALIPTCEGVAIAHYPGGSPGPASPSSVPLVAANLAVMVLAAYQFKGDDRRAMLILVGVVLLAIGAVDLVFR